MPDRNKFKTVARFRGTTPMSNVYPVEIQEGATAYYVKWRDVTGDWYALRNTTSGKVFYYEPKTDWTINLITSELLTRPNDQRFKIERIEESEDYFKLASGGRQVWQCKTTDGNFYQIWFEEGQYTLWIEDLNAAKDIAGPESCGQLYVKTDAEAIYAAKTQIDEADHEIVHGSEVTAADQTTADSYFKLASNFAVGDVVDTGKGPSTGTVILVTTERWNPDKQVLWVRHHRPLEVCYRTTQAVAIQFAAEIPEDVNYVTDRTYGSEWVIEPSEAYFKLGQAQGDPQPGWTYLSPRDLRIGSIIAHDYDPLTKVVRTTAKIIDVDGDWSPEGTPFYKFEIEREDGSTYTSRIYTWKDRILGRDPDYAGQDAYFKLGMNGFVWCPDCNGQGIIGDEFCARCDGECKLPDPVPGDGSKADYENEVCFNCQEMRPSGAIQLKYEYDQGGQYCVACGNRRYHPSPLINLGLIDEEGNSLDVDEPEEDPYRDRDPVRTKPRKLNDGDVYEEPVGGGYGTVLKTERLEGGVTRVWYDHPTYGKWTRDFPPGEGVDHYVYGNPKQEYFKLAADQQILVKDLKIGDLFYSVALAIPPAKVTKLEPLDSDRIRVWFTWYSEQAQRELSDSSKLRPATKVYLLSHAPESESYFKLAIGLGASDNPKPVKELRPGEWLDVYGGSKDHKPNWQQIKNVYPLGNGNCYIEFECYHSMEWGADWGAYWSASDPHQQEAYFKLANAKKRVRDLVRGDYVRFREGWAKVVRITDTARSTIILDLLVEGLYAPIQVSWGRDYEVECLATTQPVDEYFKQAELKIGDEYEDGKITNIEEGDEAKGQFVTILKADVEYTVFVPEQTKQAGIEWINARRAHVPVDALRRGMDVHWGGGEYYHFHSTKLDADGMVNVYVSVNEDLSHPTLLGIYPPDHQVLVKLDKDAPEAYFKLSQSYDAPSDEANAKPIVTFKTNKKYDHYPDEWIVAEDDTYWYLLPTLRSAPWLKRHANTDVEQVIHHYRTDLELNGWTILDVIDHRDQQAYFKLGSVPDDPRFTWNDPKLYVTELSIEQFPRVKEYLLEKKGKLPDVKLYGRYGIHPLYQDGIVWYDQAITRNLGPEHANYVIFHEYWHAYGHDDEDAETGAIVCSEQFAKDLGYSANLRAEVLNFIDQTKQYKETLRHKLRGDRLLQKVFTCAREHDIDIRVFGSYLRELLVPVQDERLISDDIDFALKNCDQTQADAFIRAVAELVEGTVDGPKEFRGPKTQTDGQPVESIYYTVKFDKPKGCLEGLDFALVDTYTKPERIVFEYTLDGLEADKDGTVIDRYGALADLIGEVKIRPTSALMKVFEPYIKLDREPFSELDPAIRLWWKPFYRGKRYLHAMPSAKPTAELEQLFALYRVKAENLYNRLSGHSLTLYHGTSDRFVPGIQKHGLKSVTQQNLAHQEARDYCLDCVHLTSSIPWAASAAQHTTRRFGGKPVIVQFEVPVQKLLETRMVTGLDSHYDLIRDFNYFNEYSNVQHNIKDRLGKANQHGRERYWTRFTPRDTVDQVLMALQPVHHLPTVDGSAYGLDEFTVPGGLAADYLTGIIALDKERWNGIVASIHPDYRQ
jgi:hypothetical protein